MKTQWKIVTLLIIIKFLYKYLTNLYILWYSTHPGTFSVINIFLFNHVHTFTHCSLQNLSPWLYLPWYHNHITKLLCPLTDMPPNYCITHNFCMSSSAFTACSWSSPAFRSFSYMFTLPLPPYSTASFSCPPA